MSLVNFLGLKPKTPRVKTLGVLFFGVQVLCVVGSALADCMPAGVGEMAVLDHVYDGDTIKLTDGRRVRVLGVNAPEVNHGKEQSGQALGEESRLATEAFFGANKQVRLFYDVQRLDRYGRTLAHAYDLQGNSLSAHLLRKGLGFHVVIPPNLSLNECLHAQEAVARTKGLGVWRDAYWKAIPAAHFKFKDTGFKRISGRVVNVRQAQSIWLELDGPVVIKITPADLKNFPSYNWQSWEGRQVEVRGWVTERNGSEVLKGGRSEKNPNKPLIVQPRIAGSLDLIDP